jgi:oligopeptidase B
MVTRAKTLLKREEVLGGFDTDKYVTERLYAPALDGIEIPLSIVYRKGTQRDGQNPLLLYGYGAYGLSIDPAFASPRLSLIDRGFVYAIAHIRGGQELGRQWYEDGKLLNKKNTFTDFIACAEYLIRERFTNPASCRYGQRWRFCSWGRLPTCGQTCSRAWLPKSPSSMWLRPCSIRRFR